MKKIIAIFMVMLMMLTITVTAISASDAKQEWLDQKQVSLEKQETHRQAKLDWAVDKTDENNQIVIDTGKEVLHAALNEVESWLNWKTLEAEEDSRVPDEIKENIADDVQTNLDKIDDLRLEVDNVENKLQLGLVFLKMIGKYTELLADVARNTGYMWVHIGDTYANKIDQYEDKLREKANDNEEVIEKLDLANEELERARDNIDTAKGTYQKVRVPGTPLAKFSEANNYLNAAKANLIVANKYLTEAYGLLLIGGSQE
jgi:hypothetical protein